MKILFVATVMNHLKSFHQPYMKWFQEQGWEVHVAANNDVQLNYYDEKFLIPIQRSPYSIKNLIAYKQLKEILKKERYDLIHCHTPVGGVLARISVHTIKGINTKVIYTAHGFQFYKGAPVKNWMYYPIERWLGKYTDVLITINQEDYTRAQKFKAKRIECVPGVGVDTKKFSKVHVDKIKKRRELGFPEDACIVLSVGELSKRKNHGIIIRAIAQLRLENIYYVVCGEGSLRNDLENLIDRLGVGNQVKLLGYRNDIAEINAISNIFCLPSFQEGLSVALMEAMAAGKPVVCSKIRGNTDLLKDTKGGFCINPNDVDEFAEAIKKLAMNKNLRSLMGKYNEVVIKKFDIKNVKPIMIEIYSSQFFEKELNSIK